MFYDPDIFEPLAFGALPYLFALSFGLVCLENL